MVRVLFLVLIEKGLIENADIDLINSLVKKYETKRINDQINSFKSIHKSEKSNKKLKKKFDEFNKITNE